MTGDKIQMKETENEPVILELAPLPREQVGPFLLLGLEKDADKEQIEAHWAQRVIWARKNYIRVALQEINWAREVIRDAERRVRADVASFNADTTDLVLRRLAERFGAAGPTWQPLDAERQLADYTPDTAVPDPAEVREAITLPEVPEEIPAVPCLLEQWIQEPLDPWKLDIPPDTTA
jgi:hypothetical protein